MKLIKPPETEPNRRWTTENIHLKRYKNCAQRIKAQRFNDHYLKNCLIVTKHLYFSARPHHSKNLEEKETTTRNRAKTKAKSKNHPKITKLLN